MSLLRAMFLMCLGWSLLSCQMSSQSPGRASGPVAPTTLTGAAGQARFSVSEGANVGLKQKSASMNLTRIAFGSCAHQERPQPIWDAVLAYQPQLFVFAGDNVYGDQRGGRYVPNDELIDSLTLAYQNATAIPGMVKLRNTVPYLATWDDHDYGKNDAGVELAHKRISQQLFLQFWAIPGSDPRHSREGIYSSQNFGEAGRRVQVILLDTRYFRSPLNRIALRLPGSGPYQPDPDATKTVLGDAQWAWLREQLLQPADLRLVVTSIQALSEGHGWEGWVNFPGERQRLFDLIRDTRAAGVVFLSGDRHIAALYREPAGTPYPFVEITSSGLTQSFATNREPGPNRLGDVYGKPNFGAIDIDWTKRSVELSVRSVSGEVVRQHKFQLDELKAK